MILTDLKTEMRTLLDAIFLEHFRNYSEAAVRWDEGVNVLQGPNGQGKTNLLEAIYLLGTARVLRGSRDSECIQEGHDRARVRGAGSNPPVEVEILLERGARKRAWLNGQALSRASDLLGHLACVCVSSADMALVVGEPAGRRMFLDLHLSQLYPAYLRHLAVYKRALEHRNALIRRASELMPTDREFAPWEDALAEHGTRLRAQRLAFVESLSLPAGEIHAEIARGEELSVRLEASDRSETAQELRERLEASRQADLQRGGTSVGPHRDDLVLIVGHRDARHFASQGQQRTAALALKLGVLRLSSQVLDRAPMLLLDDVFSDLDATRREQLVSLVLTLGCQVFLTCTEPEYAGQRLLKEACRFVVSDGTIRQV
jgi:DNA replication and repair protein RecF